MLQVHDMRETRVYQEAKAEGVEEGIQQGIQRERQRLISAMVAANIPTARIAELLGLDEEAVRNHIASNSPNN